MSIPPLVCSTPPPPDQCEDDKDPGDFDLSYSLSQEEDDDENNDYDYGNFSSYNHYQSNNKPLNIQDQEITQTINTGVHKEIFVEYELSKETEQSSVSHNEFKTNDINENKLKCEEDLNIEDLNLKLDEEIVTNIVENSDENVSSDQNTDSLKDLNIPCTSNNSSQDDDNTNVSSYENVIEPIDVMKQSPVELDEPVVEHSSDVSGDHEIITEDMDFSTKQKDDAQPPIIINEQAGDCSLQNSINLTEINQQPLTQLEIESDKKVIDDFGDFDDFQFVNNKTITSVVDSSNPWENNDTNEMDFGNFTANFEENKSHTQDYQNLETQFMSNNDQSENQVKEEDNSLQDDDFGDFDDFQSSTVQTETSEVQEDPCQELSVLNLQSTDNEHHIMENITKVLTSVFIEEISEPDEEFEGKLELLLSETWGHLMETDERQPYIVNWNNSLGQKTLLKALCIDSRNILFGPKWTSHGSHMPKYAANLSVAPLQPQKQASVPSNAGQSEVVADKAASKPTTWSDPFTSDGQESCNTEHESSTITPRPTDLDVFEAAMSTKSEKIYSSTLSVQPIRQINLPDTHIFTPTDSEIPRSKTIHYDPGPTVILPQPLITDTKNPTNNELTPNTSSTGEANTGDNEYWEFQDFKSTSDASSMPGLVGQPKLPENNSEIATPVNALPIPSVAYQTQLLQPIKVEPSMPTLNWPDPGEVKVEYDDFTDFVSSSQSTEKDIRTKIQNPESQAHANNLSKSDNWNDLKQTTKEVFAKAAEPENEAVDDDFNTFQSALPSKSAQNDLKTNTYGNTITQMPLGPPADFDYVSPKSNNIKSDSISFTTTPRPNEALTHNINYNSNATELTSRSSLSSSIQTTLLQPTPANFSAVNTQNQRTTGQILQPLSLESYSQINWPSPGIDLQDLSRFNPVETLQSLKSDLSVGGLSKTSSPVHTQKNPVVNQSDDDAWGEFVSSKPKQPPSQLKKPPVFAEDDEWSDFISSPSVKPQNGLNTISLNVHTNSNIQKTVQNKFSMKNNQTPVDIPTLNYITPKSNPHKTYNDKHFQNL